MEKQLHFGGQLPQTTVSKRLLPLKNRLMTAVQFGILDLFSGIAARNLRWAALFSRIVRRAAGPYLYSVKIEVNTACTLRCSMCYVPRTNTELPLQTISGLFNQLHGSGVRIELLGGEPLLRPDIADIVGAARDIARSPFISLYTNGLHADPSMAGRLSRSGLNAAIVSLISHHEKLHDSFTGSKGAWRRTIAGIGNLHRAGIPVYTFTALHKKNYRDIEDIYRFVKEALGVHALFYQYIPQSVDDPLSLSSEEWAPVKRRILLELNRAHMSFVRSFCMLTGDACSGGNFVLTVKADGVVQPCPFISDLPLGSVHERTIWHIYRNRFTSDHLTQFKTLPDECCTCSYASVCGGGCRASNTLLYGTYNSKDQRCCGPHYDRFDFQAVADRVPCFF